MQRKLLLVFSVCFALFLFLSCHHASADEFPMLDVAAFKTNMAHRLNLVIKHRDKSDNNVELDPDSITITQVLPFSAGDISLFGIILKVKDPQKFHLPPEIRVSTDKTGTLELPYVGSLVTGQEVVFAGRVNESKKENPKAIPLEFSKLVYKGNGSANIIFLTDPFCSFCRKGFDWIEENKDKIKTLRVASAPHSSISQVSSMVLAHALESKKADAWKAFEFTYTDLKSLKNQPPAEARLFTVQQYLDAFPALFDGSAKDYLQYLQKNYAKQVLEAATALRNEGFKATPFFQVDGVVVRGFHPRALLAALED